MPELGSSGSVRGVSSNGHPYRDPRASSLIRCVVGHRLQSAGSGHSQPELRDLPPIAAHRDKAQILGAHLGRLRIVKVALDAPQPGRISRVG